MRASAWCEAEQMRRDHQQRVLKLAEISAVCYFRRRDKCGRFYQTAGEAGQAVTHSLLLLQLRAAIGAKLVFRFYTHLKQGEG